jgi:hypothetical protein
MRQSSPALTGTPSEAATRKIAYVACSRGREDIEVFVESVADFSQIQNRTGDRKAAAVMAFTTSQDDRAQVIRLPCQAQFHSVHGKGHEVDHCSSAADEPFERPGG